MKLNCHCGAIEAEIKATVNELAKIVLNSGSSPVQRNTTYTSFEKYIIPKAPERRNLPMASGD